MVAKVPAFVLFQIDMKFLRGFLGVLFFFLSLSHVTGQEHSVELFGLHQVKLLEGPFKKAMEVNKRYILEMDVDRLLAPYMKEAGIQWGAENYGNWENTGLDGHIGGHYLSALSLLSAASGEEEIDQRLDYMLEHLRRAQNQAGNGYLSGVPNGKKIWNELKQGIINANNFSLNNRWVPLYNIHKIFAGLRDAYLVAGREQAKIMLIDLTDWFLDMTIDFSEEQFQQMLISEHGGLNEVFADVYALTQDPKYLKLAKDMSHQLLLKPLIESKDQLTGMHANTQIPKVIGFKRIAALSGDEEMHAATEFFWDRVVNQRSVSIGGNSVREHFHPTNNFSSMVSSEEGPETCNSYNMMRLSEQLFQYSPDRKYIDYYERTLFNHILSSQHPEKGGFVYFTSMRPNHYRVYSQPHQNFWCCVGSGLENHAKYGQAIYAHTRDDLFINLFIASELDWSEKGLKIIQTTEFPFQERSQFTFAHKGKVSSTIRIRYPGWAAPGKVSVFINGKNQEIQLDKNRYILLKGRWTKKDTIEVHFPMEVTKEQLPDGSHWYSFAYGPIVLGAKTSQEGLVGLIADDSRMGHVAAGPMIPLEWTPIINLEADPLPTKSATAFVFELDAQAVHASQGPIELFPFFTIHDSRYQVYWPMIPSDDIEQFRKQLQSQDEYVRKLEAITIDKVALGEQQPESEHKFSGEGSASGQKDGKFWRSTTASFHYELSNPNQEATTLRVMYFKPAMGEKFKISINDTEMLEPEVSLEIGPFVVMNYKLGDQSHDRLVVRIQAMNGQPTPQIHHLRLLK